MMSGNKKGRILIVDDQEGIRESMAGILELEGYEIITCSDGHKALEKVKEISFDIAFLDVKMPGIDGIETFRGIKRASPDTVVFMMTAFAEEELIRQALEEGVSACIHKPFEMDRVIEVVQNTQQRATILLLDDQLNLRDSLKDSLKRRGYRVLSASSPREAGEFLNDRSVDIVLLDSKGQMENKKVLEKIKEATGDERAKIIMLNSVRVDGEVGEVITVGTEKFLKKPLDVSVLEKVVKELLREKEIAAGGDEKKKSDGPAEE
ncbi:MAG: response regulator [Endomicrobiales bacterium]